MVAQECPACATTEPGDDSEVQVRLDVAMLRARAAHGDDHAVDELVFARSPILVLCGLATLRETLPSTQRSRPQCASDRGVRHSGEDRAQDSGSRRAHRTSVTGLPSLGRSVSRNGRSWPSRPRRCRGLTEGGRHGALRHDGQESGTRAQDSGGRARRNPLPPSRLDGRPPTRYAERQRSTPFHAVPPRRTRPTPVGGPFGSVSAWSG